MPSLILLRHGQSTWNQENRFTGDADVDLSVLGQEEARLAGLLLTHYIINIAYTSTLKRAIHTVNIVLNEMGKNIPVIHSAALNERNYGDLQGLNKNDTINKYGAEKVLLWRRSFESTPPHGESLKDTYARVVPYYTTVIEPQLKVNKNVLVVAHGNSLRALMMHLDGFTADEIAEVDIATGIPRMYEFSLDLTLEKAHYLEK